MSHSAMYTLPFCLRRALGGRSGGWVSTGEFGEMVRQVTHGEPAGISIFLIPKRKAKRR